MDFQKRDERIASPFQWIFTRQDLGDLLAQLPPRAACCRGVRKYVAVILVTLYLAKAS